MGFRAYLPFVLGMGELGMGAEDPLVKQTPAERMINKADLNSLIGEYYLIKQKKSRLSSNQRNLVECRIEYLIKKGTIKTNQ